MADSFQDRIGVFYSGLSKGHKRIADFIKNNYEKASFMTAAKLGKTVGVSESTVVRFASHVGFDGYPELQKHLQELVKSHLTSVQRMEVAANRIRRRRYHQRRLCRRRRDAQAHKRRRVEGGFLRQRCGYKQGAQDLCTRLKKAPLRLRALPHSI